MSVYIPYLPSSHGLFYVLFFAEEPFFQATFFWISLSLHVGVLPAFFLLFFSMVFNAEAIPTHC